MPDAKRQVWPVSILAEGTGIDPAIFVYQASTSDDPIPQDRFTCVATVNQMYEIPKTQSVSVSTTHGIPFYRSNILEYVVRTADEAERIWQVVQSEVQDLLSNWNSSLSLQATSSTLITGDAITNQPLAMYPPIRKQLSYHPAGTVTTVNGKQSIVTPNGSLAGWLPANYGTTPETVPPGGAFYYNMAMDPDLYAVWPPLEPLSGNQLYRNGLLLPYGVVYIVNNTTIWWLDFDPATIPGYQRVAGQGGNDGNAPWPLGYVTAANPGPSPNILVLTLFKSI